MKEESVVKMEFLLTLNNNIVVQRFYNVKNYNPLARKSYDLAYFMKEVETMLSENLKMKTVIYMMDNKDAISHDPSIMNTSYTDGPEVFNIYVKVGDTTICHRVFDGKFYPPKVRYTVDVRPFLKEVLRELTDIFSGENFSTQYMNYQLA